MPSSIPSMLIALTAAQFLVHAIGWGMSAVLFRGLRAAEGHFAASWLLLAAGLSLHVPAVAPGGALEVAGDATMVASLLLLHRGLVRYYGLAAPDRLYALGLLLVVALLAAAGLDPDARVGRTPLALAAMACGLVATAILFWRHARADTPLLGAAAAAGLAATGGVLLWQAVAATAAAATAAADVPAAAAPIVVALFGGGLVNLLQIRLVLGRVLQRLQAQAQLDMLTGVANRRGLAARLAELHERARRARRPYGLLMVDIDHFKSINDRFGHAAGDDVLRRVARQLVDHLRSGDQVGRWGGEEFCLLLPRVDDGTALALAQRMRLAVAAEGVTVSIGLAMVDPGRETIAEALRRADAAMYDAKRGGRDRVEVAPRQP